MESHNNRPEQHRPNYATNLKPIPSESVTSQCKPACPECPPGVLHSGRSAALDPVDQLFEPHASQVPPLQDRTEDWPSGGKGLPS